MRLSEAQACPSIVKSIIMNQRAWFEKAVIRVLLEERALVRRLMPLLCKHPKTGEFMGDFQNTNLNSFYRVMMVYFESVGIEAPTLQGGLFKVIVDRLVDDGEYLVEGEQNVLSDLFDEIASLEVSNATPVVCEGVLYWIQQRRMESLLADYEQGDDPDALKELVNDFTRPIKEHGEEDYGFDFGHGVRNELLDVVRIPTGIVKLDKRLGGGFGYTEYTLGIACQGGGKTVAAMQIASGMALNGYKGVVITTEQPHEQLEPRVVSCHSRIPFELIKDRVSKSTLSVDQWAAYETLETKLKGKLKIVDWNTRHGKTVVSDLENEIITRREQMGGLDFLVLDWLGGNLGAQGMTPEMRRVLMKDASDCLGRLAQDYNIATIGFAQVNMKQGANRKKLASEHISENKQLGEKAATIFGISSLLTTEDISDGSDYRKDQFFYISKARKSIGGLVPVTRDFAYQRFASR